MLRTILCLASMLFGITHFTSAAPTPENQSEIAYYNIKAVGGPADGHYLTIAKGQVIYEPKPQNPPVEIAINETSQEAHDFEDQSFYISQANVLSYTTQGLPVPISATANGFRIDGLDLRFGGAVNGQTVARSDSWAACPGNGGDFKVVVNVPGLSGGCVPMSAQLDAVDLDGGDDGDDDGEDL